VSILYSADAVLIDIVLVQGNDFEMVINVEGDISAYSFAAALKPQRGTTTTTFTDAVGSYNAGTDSTPVTLTLTDAQTDALEAGFYYWDGKWTTGGGLERTIVRGALEVVRRVTT
jgi:hypothetical protein